MAKKIAVYKKISPEDMTVHMLLADISKAAKCAMHKESEAAGLSHSYRAIIFHLSRTDGITQLELSRLTQLKPPTISVTLQKMESEGLVSRKSDGEDLRKTIVTLTDKGRGIISRIEEVFDDYDKTITNSLTKSEIETLKTLLIKVRAGVLAEKEENKKV